MKFTHFIKNHQEDITNEWVEFAQDNISGINKLQPEEVRDHIKQMLDRIVESMETSETDTQLASRFTMKVRQYRRKLKK